MFLPGSCSFVWGTVLTKEQGDTYRNIDPVKRVSMYSLMLVQSLLFSMLWHITGFRLSLIFKVYPLENLFFRCWTLPKHLNSPFTIIWKKVYVVKDSQKEQLNLQQFSCTDSHTPPYYVTSRWPNVPHLVTSKSFSITTFEHQYPCLQFPKSNLNQFCGMYFRFVKRLTCSWFIYERVKWN